MKTNNIKTINTYQQQMYDRFEKETARQLFDGYIDVLEKMKSRNTLKDINIGEFLRVGGGKSLKIIDLGGGAGYFASLLRSYFPDKRCEIFVIDTTQYDTWEKYAGQITFIKDSAENLIKLFAEETFDLVFANRVFHHFVKNSWKESFKGMADIMKQIAFILKKNGHLCITDYFYNGGLNHSLTSRIIYMLTSIKFKPVVALFRKMDAKTAGIGVCFLSKNMWLNLFYQADFSIDALIEGTNFKLPWYKKVCVFNKNSSEDNIIVLQK
jgi:SAM-dependent methyltransferase